MLGRRIYYDEYDLTHIIETELFLYPEARLVDLFKLLNQAYFGPSHIEPDRDKIKASLKSEIMGLKRISTYPFQDIGNGNTFVRVSLSYLIGAVNVDLSDLIINFSKGWLLEKHKQDRLTEELLENAAEAILQSRFSKPISPITWKHVWSNALPVVLYHYEPRRGELEEIDRLLRENQMPSHSEPYHKAYDPHYRVFNRKMLFRYLNIWA